MTKLSTSKNGRAARRSNGRFAEGNPGGPGRPRRAVEREYLACLSDAMPLKRWQKVVSRVAGRAEKGERWAVEWLSKYLLGEPQTLSLTLTELAQREALGIDPEREIEAGVDMVRHPAFDPHDPFDVARVQTVVDRALALEISEKASQARARVEGEPELQPYREVLEAGVKWNADNKAGYWEWVATAPIETIVEWAKENLDDGAAQAQADIAQAIAGDTEAARRIREITEGGRA